MDLKPFRIRSDMSKCAPAVSRGSSYEEVARNIGSVVLAIAAGWLVVGTPGAPQVSDWVAAEALPRAQLVLAVVTAAFVAELTAQLLQWRLSWLVRVLRFPRQVLLAAQILAGVATIGAAATMSGPLLLRIVG